ncbi:hypothetical protein DOU11_02145 [Clavibacter michiganensis subsp. michiganensis]|nr:hypothetical protein [Clavibacter michiganensis subsp. michiganensis]
MEPESRESRFVATNGVVARSLVNVASPLDQELPLLLVVAEKAEYEACETAMPLMTRTDAILRTRIVRARCCRWVVMALL